MGSSWQDKAAETPGGTDTLHHRKSLTNTVDAQQGLSCAHLAGRRSLAMEAWREQQVRVMPGQQQTEYKAGYGGRSAPPDCLGSTPVAVQVVNQT